MNMVKNTLAAILVVAMANIAYALPITNLYNTGVSDNGTVLAGGAADSHYDITAAPSGSGVIPRDASVYTGVWPIAPAGPWIANTDVSKWIGLSGNPLTAAQGYYTYKTTFNVQSGYDLSSLVINGRWSTDNAGTNIFLNGHSLGLSAVGFTSWSNFNISQDYFTQGINTLDFIVNNYPQSTGNPTGLRVEFISTDGQTAVPEPGTMILLGFGMVGLAVYGKRRMNKEA